MISELPEPAAAGPLLSCSRISKHYGGVRALKEVTWELQPGEVHALCGENGAGKSSLARICAGIARADGGALRLAGQVVQWADSAQARRAGIAIILQELDLFGNLTVAENVAIGNPALESSRWVSFPSLAEAVRPHLEAAGLSVDPGTPLGTLSVSQWQLVAIARVLALDARVIFMDEPTSALTEDAVERLFGVIDRLRARGVAIAYVSHKMPEIFRISDRITVMRDGEVIGTSRTSDTTVERVIREMVGRPIEARRQATAAGGSEEVLRVDGLTNRKLRGISFSLARGEVLGVAGLVASGRSELGRTLFGLSSFTAGAISVAHQPYRPSSVQDALRAGLALVPEDRRQDGLFMRMGVRDNASLACLSTFASAGWVDGKAEAAAVERQLAQSRTKYADAELPVDSLSGGNQQKVLIAKWLLTHPRVCFLDDPTRGIDVGAKADVYALIASLAAGGVGIIWVSSELPELIANCARILVLHEGALHGVLEGATATQEAIMQLATGGKARA